MARPRLPELSLEEATAVIKRHKGAAAKIADQLGVRGSAVSQVLSGRCSSRRIEEEIRTKALDLLEQERKGAA